MNPNQLPPLPEPDVLAEDGRDKHGDVAYKPGFTADQMHAYALAALAQQAQEPVGDRYFTHSTDWSFEEYATREEAIKSANAQIEQYREDAIQGAEWPGEVDSVCWGVILGRAKEIDTSSDDHESVDYQLCDTTPQPQPVTDIDEAEISRMTERGAKAWAGVEAQVLREGGHPAPQAVKCRTCNDHGLIGGHMQDGSGYGEPCPDCNAPLAGEVTDEQIVDALEREFGTDLAFRNFEDDVRAARAILALRPAAQPAVEPLLVRDLAEMIGSSVPEVCKAFIALGHPPHSTNMAVHPDDAVAVAKHLRPQAVPMTDAQPE